MLIDELSGLTIRQMTERYKDKSLCPIDVMEATLNHVAAVNPNLNALYDLQVEASLAAAERAKRNYRTNQPCGPLEGVPVTVKDSIHTAGMRWHHGSATHGQGVLAETDAPPAAALRRAGAIIIAKTVMPDYGLSASGVSSSHGVVRNPWNLRMSPGGSSAGSAAALAAGIGAMSVGTDIAGSVRLPASQCGLAAMKPTQGLIAHTPASTVRSAGPMSRHAADLELLLKILADTRVEDDHSVPLAAVIRPPSRPARVRVLLDFGFGPVVEPDVVEVVKSAAAELEALGAQVAFAGPAFDFDAYIPIDDSLRLRGWREYAGTPLSLRAHIPPSLLDWFAPAMDWDANRIRAIETDLARTIAATAALFGSADMLLTPVMPMVGFPVEALGPNPSMPLRHATFTAPFNQSGHPAVSICGGMSRDGLPIGVQLVALHHHDFWALRLASQLEERCRLRHPVHWPLFQENEQHAFASSINRQW